MQYQYQQQPPPAPAGAPMPMPPQQQQQPPPQEAANPFDQFDQPAPQPAPMQQPPMQQPPMQMQQPPMSSLVPAQQQPNANANQWGLPQQQPPPAVPPQAQAQQPFGMPAPVPAPAPVQQAPQTNFDPFSSTPAAPAAAAMAPMPPAAAPVQTYQQQQAPLDLAVASPPPAAAPPAAPSDDPFGVFAAAPAPVQPQAQPVHQADAYADPFGLGTSYQHGGSSNGLNESYASSVSNSAHGSSSAGDGLGLFTAGTDPTIGAAASSWLDVSDLTHAAAGNAEGSAYVAASGSSNPGVLPPGGEHFQVDIPDRLLGLVMYKPTAAKSCGILAHHNAVTVEALGPSRPVVTHLNTNSAAKAAGVALGDVITAINGREVADRVDASNLIRSAPRPVTLQMYRLPGAPTTLYQGDVWVHYKNRDPLPPPKEKDWKAKFVVVGGILGGGNGSKVINMYRSRAEYDQAVADVHSSRKVSVKVKQFSLEGGARLWFKDGTTDGGMSGSDGMETIKYPNEDQSRQYVNILMPKPANNIKLSVPGSQTNQLRSVLDGIRLALYMYSN